MYTCSSNSLQGQTYVIGNYTPSSSNNWYVVICAAYAVDKNSNGSVDFYYRFYVQTHGSVNTTLQSAYCGGNNFGGSMAGTYLQGASGADWYYGTSCGSNQYDYKATLEVDSGDVNETNYVGWVGGSGTVYKTSVTLKYITPKSVKFDAKGGSGAPATQIKYQGQNLTISSTKPTKSGYTFKGWDTSSNATTVRYSPGSTYSGNTAMTLYAVWQLNTYTVSYNNNGGSGTIANQTKTYGQALTLSSGSGFSRTGYTLKSWNTDSSGTGTTYALSGSYTGNAALTLYAKWQINTWAVSYNKNTTDTVSNMPSNQTKTYGANLTLSSNVPTRAGYKFQGWATSSSSTTVAYMPGATYSSNAALTLYAIWSPIPLFVNTSSGYKRASNIYVYDTSGNRKTAISVTVYDSSGKAHTMRF